MSRNRVICGIEHALKNDGCNELPAGEIYERVRRTRGNLTLAVDEFLAALEELEEDGLYEGFGDEAELSLTSLVARSQTHPAVPLNPAPGTPISPNATAPEGC